MSRSRLLVAVSSPRASENLAEPIADIATRLDADALVAHVAFPQDEDENESEARQRGETTLQLLADALKQKGIEAEAVMLFSTDISRAILNTAKARECTLIVLGLTGKNALQRIIGGDVPSAIIRNAEMPVLLCPSNWDGTI